MRAELKKSLPAWSKKSFFSFFKKGGKWESGERKSFIRHRFKAYCIQATIPIQFHLCKRASLSLSHSLSLSLSHSLTHSPSLSIWFIRKMKKREECGAKERTPSASRCAARTLVIASLQVWSCVDRSKPVFRSRCGIGCYRLGFRFPIRFPLSTSLQSSQWNIVRDFFTVSKADSPKIRIQICGLSFKLDASELFGCWCLMIELSY